MQTDKYLVFRSSAAPSGAGAPRIFIASTPDRWFGWARQLRASMWCAVIRETGSRHIGTIAIPCRMQSPRNRTELDSGKVKLDSSARYGLGIPESLSDGRRTVSIASITKKIRQSSRDTIASAFGFRYVVMRVSKSLPFDAERPIFRVQESVFDILGCQPGDRAVIISAIPSRDGKGIYSARWKDVNAQGFQISRDDYVERLSREVSEPDWQNYWLASSEALGLDVDVPRIFVPREVRETLAVNEGSAVLVRRHIPSLFAKNFREFGLLVLLSSLTVFQLPWAQSLGLREAVALLIVALSIAVGITGLSIRGKVLPQ